MSTKAKGYEIYHDLVINAPVGDIFTRLTKPEHLVNWWPLRCSGSPELDAEYNFYFDEAYDWYGKVIKVKENQSFHIKMTDSDSDWNLTSFGFDLEETDQGVQVRFRHIGWPECNAHFKRSSYCWAMLLNGLKNYTERGSIVPFSERD